MLEYIIYPLGAIVGILFLIGLFFSTDQKE
ncbi:putative membrane protein [Flavobacterium sp. HSC-61S13]|nr:putative membrane protein [Flavobacterium sp. HSC-61S13]